MASERVVPAAAGGGCDERHADRLVAEVAGRQRKRISTRQLRAVGLTKGAIAHRVEVGRLHPQHRGVYLVGSRVPLAPEQAALLAVESAPLTRGSAGSLGGTFPPTRVGRSR